MDGNTTDSGKYHGESNILIDEDATGKTTPSDIMQTMSTHNDKATNEKGGLEDEALLSSIKHEIPQHTVGTKNTGSEDFADNGVKGDKEGDMLAVETEKCVPLDNLHEPSPLKQNVLVCDHLSNIDSKNTLDEAQHNGETTEKVVFLSPDTVESNSTETTELIVIDVANRENGETPDKAPVDSVYREKQDESCDSSSDSEESVIFVQEEHDKIIVIESDDQEENKSKGKKDSDIRTKGEVYPEELPPLQELVITVDPNVELVHTGTITGIVGCLVIIKANQNIPPLNENTILFLEGRIVLGQIFEVFGPVGSPWYSLRFNSSKDIENKSVTCGQKVYCAPKVENLTNYVFVEHLRQMRGSDASWEDNNEPPEKYIDYSDDEEERRAKAKARNRGNESEDGHQLPGGRKVRRRRQRDKEPAQQNGTDESISGMGNGSPNNSVNGNKREFNQNQSGRGRNFNQRGGRPQGQPRMEYQSFQPFGAPPRFPQTPETPSGPVGYQNGGPVRQPVFQPRYPDASMSQSWNNHQQTQSNWNQRPYPNTAPTQTTNYPYSMPSQTNGQYYPQFSGGYPNMSLPPPNHCFGQPPPVFNRQMMTDQRYIQNPAFQQNQGPQFDPNVPPPNFNV